MTCYSLKIIAYLSAGKDLLSNMCWPSSERFVSCLGPMCFATMDVRGMQLIVSYQSSGYEREIELK